TELATEQFGGGNFIPPATNTAGNLTTHITEKTINFSSQEISGSFDLSRGELTSYTHKNQELIEHFPEPSFWRAPTDNDFGNDFPKRNGVWRSATTNKKLLKATAEDPNQSGIKITAIFLLTDVQTQDTILYHIRPDGSIQITESMSRPTNLPDLPRYGMLLNLPKKFNQIRYYGRGPWENYNDRNTASFIKIYDQELKDQFVSNYIRPQENGYRTDVRWVELSDGNGAGLRITGTQPICFSALPFTDEDLDPGLTKKNRHPADLHERNFISLHIDLKQRGVGGDNSWGALPHEPYLLKEPHYTYSYILEPIR
ncbi:MAG: beta-galactosidase, partial [Bacteroidetes bacterium]|nr:beta-galactosidase [Bacteroidota bacterium]